MADEEHILFISGNLIHIFNVESKELQFRRSARGGGIGHIVVIFIFINHISTYLLYKSCVEDKN